MTDQSPSMIYSDRSQRFAEEAAALDRRCGQVGNLRLLVAVAAITCGGFAIWSRTSPLGALAVVLAIGFAVLVWRHSRLRSALRRASLLRRVNDEASHRLQRDWKSLPSRHSLQADPGHPYASDLDIFGSASLFQLIHTTATPMGDSTLAGWLLEPAPAAILGARRAAVAELASRLEMRQELEVRGRLGGDRKPDPEPFLAWAEGGPWLIRQRWALWAARLSPVLFWASLIAWTIHLLPIPVWLLFGVGNIGLALWLGGRTDEILSRVRSQEGSFRSYADSLQLLEDSFESELLQRLRREIELQGRPAHAHMRGIGRLGDMAVPSSSGLGYLLMQGLFLWNLHVLALVEGWQVRVGGRCRSWLEALGQFEALAALAGLAHAHPDWVYAEVDATATGLETVQAGHPLLAPAARVDNDVTLGPVGTFLLVSGSNMSGKSTLLRTLGVNIVLAQAGGPVCARSLRVPALRLWTSMRLADSLERGVSFFLAEVQRLKQVVDAAGVAGQPRLCFLLDEILQGTNTAERQTAARRVIRHLVARGALGAVSTHDLTLADTPEMAAIARPVHLRETITGSEGRAEMTFDHLVRPGLATSTNALKLMEIVGLGLDD